MNTQWLPRANALFRQGDYLGALLMYFEALPTMGEHLLAANIQLCIQRLGQKGIHACGASGGRKLRALTLFDRFSESCFSPELDITPLSRSAWRQQLATQPFDLFFAEAVWDGNRGLWRDCMIQPHSAAAQELGRVLKACRQQRIPTAIWTKEDPADFAQFLQAACQFDHIFTTDSGCVPDYRNVTGHSRVHVLPFAAQPALHHPLRASCAPPRDHRIAFAGAWYGAKYPQRAAWLGDILGELQRRDRLIIYDRNFTKTTGASQFPYPLSTHAVPAIDYEQLCSQAYKAHAAFINVNSVQDSSTMMARRIYELLACGTPVISSPSPALKNEFTEFVYVANSAADLNEILSQLNDPVQRAYRRDAAIRSVLAKHTYAQRMDSVRFLLGLPSYQRRPPGSASPAEPGVSLRTSRVH